VQRQSIQNKLYIDAVEIGKVMVYQRMADVKNVEPGLAI